MKRQNHIDALICTKQDVSWRIIGFYVKPEEHMRHETWDLLKYLSTQNSTPWLCIEDYNEILSAEEKDGRLPKPMHLMQEFRSSLLYCGLIDLGYIRNIFTWDNGHEGADYVQERLDRACATLAWRELFPYSKVSHFPVSYSDHVPIILNTQVKQHHVWPRSIPRRFEEKWATHPNCEAIIQHAWTTVIPTGSPMFILFEKIKQCRMALVDWSKVTFGASSHQLKAKHQVLHDLYTSNVADNCHAIRSVKDEINTILYQDELHWWQCSRSIWLQAGDKNTKFFH